MHISIHRMYIHITYMKEMSYIYIDVCIQNAHNYDLFIYDCDGMLSSLIPLESSRTIRLW